MIAEPVTAQDWLRRAREAVEEMAAGSLGLEPVPSATTLPAALPGAWVALAGPETLVHVGLLSTAEGCQDLARALVSPGAERPQELAEPAVADALAGLVGAIGGKLSVRLSEAESVLRVGRAFAIEQPLEPPDSATTMAETLELGSIPVRVVVTHRELGDQPAPCSLPSATAVAGCLQSLSGRRIGVKPVVGTCLRHSFVGTAAEFRRSDGSLAAVCAMSLELAVVAGAAPALVPASVAEQYVRRSTLPPHLADNVREVVNVLGTGLFNGPATPHVTLAEFRLLRPPAPPGLIRRLGKPFAQSHLELDIEGYGKGRLSLFVY